MIARCNCIYKLAAFGLAICTSLACVYAQEGIATSIAMDSLRSIEEKVLKILPKVKPCVVCLQSGGGSGSGVIVSADGLVLTAAHVIDKAKELTIVYPDGRKFKGEALGTYGPADAGMARILEGGPHPFVEVHSGKDLKKNDTVIALGHPSGFDVQRGPPLRIGHITDIDENFITMDTALIGGDSGGPSFDLEGRVVGIHSHIAGEIHLNCDSNIAPFHTHWDAMKSGIHHELHYSKSIGKKSGPESKDESKQSKPTPPARNPSEPSRLQELAEKAKGSGGKLKLSREELRSLRKSLASRTEELAPAGGTRMIDEWAATWVSGFESMRNLESKPDMRPTVCKVQVDGRHVAMATCVHGDGWFVTKASEVKNRTIQLLFATAEDPIDAEVRAFDDQHDLAILFADTKQYEPFAMTFDTGSSSTHPSASTGSLCFCIGVSDKPAGFGVVSVAARPLNGKSGAHLGVVVQPDGGKLRVEQVAPKSPAAKAGLKPGDQILAVDGVAVGTDEELQKIVQSHLEGDQLKLDVEREDASLSAIATLEDSTQVAPMPGAREQGMDSITSRLSKRRWGFAKGIQHDCAILAKDVGGPLVGLDGQIYGINIARAGRIHSYAIPMENVHEFLVSAKLFHMKDSKP